MTARANIPEEVVDKLACVVSTDSWHKVIEIVRSSPCRLVELRTDLLGLDRDLALPIIGKLADYGYSIIATFRNNVSVGETSKVVEILDEIAECCAYLVDVEYNSVYLNHAVKKWGDKLIVSFHEYRWTPRVEILYSYAGEIISHGARIAKIVTMARKFSDNWRVLAVNAKFPKRAVSFAMGRKGVLSRLLAPYYGAPFTYVYIGEKPVAPGQLKFNDIVELWSLLGLID